MFGGMSIITHDFLVLVNKKYNIDLLLNRYKRQSFERVIACLFQMFYINNSLLGNIISYCPYVIRYENREEFKHLPFLKVWTGR